jgi:hypothetical protein
MSQLSRGRTQTVMAFVALVPYLPLFFVAGIAVLARFIPLVAFGFAPAPPAGDLPLDEDFLGIVVASSACWIVCVVFNVFDDRAEELFERTGFALWGSGGLVVRCAQVALDDVLRGLEP